jgi:hypothetical protein
MGEYRLTGRPAAPAAVSLTAGEVAYVGGVITAEPGWPDGGCTFQVALGDPSGTVLEWLTPDDISYGLDGSITPRSLVGPGYYLPPAGSYILWVRATDGAGVVADVACGYITVTGEYQVTAFSLADAGGSWATTYPAGDVFDADGSWTVSGLPVSDAGGSWTVG